MDFKVVVSKKAQREIENTIDYYQEINDKLAYEFYLSLQKTYNKLGLNPY